MADRHRFDVSLVTPDGPAYEGEAELIVVPGQAGDIGVLARHAPLIATLKAGSTRIYLDWDAGDRRRRQQRNHHESKDRFQMSLRKRLMLALGRRGLKRYVR